MANETMVLLEKIVVPSGGASSVEFTNIPQGYTDLCIKFSARDSLSNGTIWSTGNLKFNGVDTNQTSRWLRGYNNGTVNSGNYTLVLFFEPTAGATANTFGSGELYVPNYSNTSYNKSVSMDTVAETNGNDGINGLTAGLWSSTSAITSIALVPGSSYIQYSTFYLYGVAKQGVTPTNAPAATGGDSIVFDGTYWIHTFYSSGTFTPKKALTCDYLVVAGGGGGGGEWRSGGGGAGGLRSTVTATGGGGSLESALSLVANTAYTVTVGAGGAARATANANGGNGSNSVFSTITSTGGGGGGADAVGIGSSGGSGGGGNGNAGGGAGGSGTANQGYAGGTGNNSPSGYGGGGGGGAGAVGGNGTSTNGGNGGNGVATSISGSSVTYAGGGGGGVYGTGTAGTGGTGGGGAGGVTNQQTSGSQNTGGGGGGAGNSGTFTTGGSGIVIVRYAA